MKFIWEEQDVIPGRRFASVDNGEIWIIGSLNEPDENGNHLVSVHLQTGEVTGAHSLSDLMESLSDDCVPAEMLEIVRSLNLIPTGSAQ